MKYVVCSLVFLTLSLNQATEQKLTNSNSFLFESFDSSEHVKKNHRSVEASTIFFPFTQEDCKYAVLHDTR